MTELVVLDSCSFKEVYEDLANERRNLGHAALALIFARGKIALDAEGKLRHEWRMTCCGEQDEFFNMWVSDKLVADLIVLFEIKRSDPMRNFLKSCGMPNKDHLLFHLAVCSKSKFLESPSGISKPLAFRRPG